MLTVSRRFWWGVLASSLLGCAMAWLFFPNATASGFTLGVTTMSLNMVALGMLIAALGDFARDGRLSPAAFMRGVYGGLLFTSSIAGMAIGVETWGDPARHPFAAGIGLVYLQAVWWALASARATTEGQGGFSTDRTESDRGC
ncbi:MAG: hypothetical protein ACK4XJ_04845 [Fimbriimonadaceae bacterium]